MQKRIVEIPFGEPLYAIDLARMVSEAFVHRSGKENRIVGLRKYLLGGELADLTDEDSQLLSEIWDGMPHVGNASRDEFKEYEEIFFASKRAKNFTLDADFLNLIPAEEDERKVIEREHIKNIRTFLFGAAYPVESPSFDLDGIQISVGVAVSYLRSCWIDFQTPGIKITHPQLDAEFYPPA